jgi:succinate dehydrogenase / fumarate reductase flavoprotein subunit
MRTNVCNVLVIGSGAAGMRAAIAAHEAGAAVLVVGKRPRLDAHTVLASGGINGALGTRDPEDSWEQHYADTIREGYLLSHPRVVEIMTKEAPDAILELADWGCEFARTEEGKIDQRFFGAHYYRRTCYAGDFTGRAVLRTVHQRAANVGVPSVLEDPYIAQLLIADGTCFGAIARFSQGRARRRHQ